MPKKMIIGFGYKRLRGKDTAADILTEMLASRGIRTRRDAFAASLKSVCQTVFGFTDEQVHTVAGKEAVDPFWGFTPRWALQKVGTEAFRQQIDPDVWVKTVEKRFTQSEESVIIADVRFPNEALMVKRLGGTLIKVDRNIPSSQNSDQTSRSMWQRIWSIFQRGEHKASKDQHASETALDSFSQWDFTIDNNSTLDHLKQQLQDIVETLI